jgi:tagaturonate reductase
MTKKRPAEIANAINDWLERFMPLLTPMGVLAGFLLPGILIQVRPYVPVLFAVMTLSGALRLTFREFGRVLKNPLAIGLFFLSSHVLMPLTVRLAAPLVFQDQDIVAGYILLYSVPTAVSGFIWVSIFRGDRALGLTLILLDTLLAPLIVPGAISILLGAEASLDMRGIALSLILMVALPTIAGLGINEISRGKVPDLACPYLDPLAKLCIVTLIAANASPVAHRIRIEDPQVWLIGALCVVFAAAGYVISKVTGALGRLDAPQRTTLFFSGGLRNISAATTVAIDFFPVATALPCLLGIVFQQFMAAVMGRLMLGRRSGKD